MTTTPVTPTTPATPALNGQVIGQAHFATRALLDRVLDRTGTSFPQSLVLNTFTDDAAALERGQLTGRLVVGLKITDSAAAAVLDELTAAQLLQALPGDEARLRLTDAGRALKGDLQAGTIAIAQRLYGDLPAEDLATAGRVLTLVTARANVELAEAQQADAR